MGRPAAVSGSPRRGLGRLPALLVAAFALALPGHAAGPGAEHVPPADEAAIRQAGIPAPDPSERFPGGAATSPKNSGPDAFSRPSATLDREGRERFAYGHALFGREWTAEAEGEFRGLGPLFNARSCEGCHVRNGRGHPPQTGDAASSMVLRLSRAPRDPGEQALLKNGTLVNMTDDIYGAQLQDFSVGGSKPEGQIELRYEEHEVSLPDGTAVTLRKPLIAVAGLAYGAMDVSVTLSPRVAPPMIGLGLIEAIHAEDILARADPEDADGDGISGRANIVRDPFTGQWTLGRFGWKAQAASLRQQAAEALHLDMGLSTPELPRAWGDCTASQAQCREAAAAGLSPEASTEILDLLAFYSRHLAVPARRDEDDADIQRGRGIFHEIGCAACHVPSHATATDADDPPLAGQHIWPYSDFLLHDMGLGLTDWQIVGAARGGEWRTPPLWGIGLTRAVSGHNFLLHDGRARNLTEAILWHGGEGEASRDAFGELRAKDRQALLRFIETL